MRPPPRVQAQPPPSQLLTLGCAGAILGAILATCGLSLAGLLMAFATPAAPAAPPVADPAQADITITIQEAYFTHMLTGALPADWANDLKFDVQPGNRLVLTGRLKADLFGQTLEGDVSAAIRLNATGGNLTIQIEDVNVSGLSLGAEEFTNQLSDNINQIINDQVRAGLGPTAYILSVTTDDKQLVIRARWQ